MPTQWFHRMRAWMNVCLSNGTDWIGQELFYFITCWELNNAAQIRAYLWLPFHLIQHISQIFPRLSLCRHGLCDCVKREQAFTWYPTCEFCGAWYSVFGQLMEWTSAVIHAVRSSVSRHGNQKEFDSGSNSIIVNDSFYLTGSLTFFENNWGGGGMKCNVYWNSLLSIDCDSVPAYCKFSALTNYMLKKLKKQKCCKIVNEFI